MPLAGKHHTSNGAQNGIGAGQQLGCGAWTGTAQRCCARQGTARARGSRPSPVMIHRVLAESISEYSCNWTTCSPSCDRTPIRTCHDPRGVSLTPRCSWRAAVATPSMPSQAARADTRAYAAQPAHCPQWTRLDLLGRSPAKARQTWRNSNIRQSGVRNGSLPPGPFALDPHAQSRRCASRGVLTFPLLRALSSCQILRASCPQQARPFCSQMADLRTDVTVKE